MYGTSMLLPKLARRSIDHVAMTSTTTDTLSIQPWARKGGEEGSLKDVLARVNVERGHFRDITETSLQEEIAADGALELSETDEDEEDDDEQQAEKVPGQPTTREELYRAKYEMLANVRAAEQEILMSLDFISLLLSKDAPKQATATISPFLKDAVPLGSLGTDLWQRMPADKARNAQDGLLATNVKMESLQQSADDLLSAASRLQDNVRKETEYWNQVLSISERGWNVCRIPGQQHRLAVRFGFSESSPEFSRRGMAALIPSSSGAVMLERGIGRKPKGLHVVLRKGDRIVGTSKLPNVPDSEETTLEARIQYARDSLYDEELYHELIRESRTLSSLGVSMKDTAINFGARVGMEEGFDVSLDLVTLDETQHLRFDASNTEDRIAEATALAARLLLSQAHREHLKRRAAIPAPLSDKRKEDRPLLPILRPILSFVMHHATMQQLNTYVDTITQILELAKVEIVHRTSRIQLSHESEVLNAENLVSILLQPWESIAQLTLKDTESNETSFDFRVHTELASFNSFASVITLAIPARNELHRFESVKDFVSAADAKISSSLATALLATVSDDWDCDENEATLIKDTGIGEKSESIWITLDSHSKTISLNSFVNKVAWEVKGESSSTSLWEAADGLAQTQSHK
jgi:mediator of RNA polymerase II transcription subunit 17